VSPDRGTVYAAGFHSGNRTTTVSEGAVCDAGINTPPCDFFGTIMPGGLPPPNTNFQLVNAPEVGLIVHFNATSGHWEDELGRNWDVAVRFDLPDRDVFAIDANDLAAPPIPFAGVGTVLFNMIANPVSGKVYVTNTEARNDVRFEGPGVFGGTTVRGHLHESRITVLDGSAVEPRQLNKHIDYGVVPSPPGVAEASLAIPLDMAITADGSTLYVAAFGSSEVGVFGTAALEADTFTPDAADHIAVPGGGPSGLVLNEAHGLLYVLTRFDDAVSVIDLGTRAEIAHHAVHDPEPPAVVAGRPILYDARLSSSNGEASCASCHVFGDLDSLAWDLGNPDDIVIANPNPFEFGTATTFHPMKGPMTTQSLRGMANHGPMHWRGDRTGGIDGGDPLDEDAAFKRFAGAFDSLLGRGAPLGPADMQKFTDFILQVTYPPNPVRNLNDTLTASQQAGHDLFFGRIIDGVRNCVGCHVLDPAAGYFGTDGESSIDGEPQSFKIPHLRNLYQKIGMFGMPAVPFFGVGDNTHKGDQVRGFGFTHDGSVDTLFRFHLANVFSTNGPEAASLEQFVLAMDSNLKPVVGQQVTLTALNAAAAGPRIDLLIAQAAAGACELTVKGVLAGLPRGWLRQAGGSFQSDRAGDATLTDAQLRAQATTPGQERTYHCVPPGSGLRAGLDRDEDGFFDRDELDAGSDPADASSMPPGATTTTTSSTTTTSTLPGSVFIPIPTTKLMLRDRSASPADPDRRRVTFKSSTLGSGVVTHIVPPARLSAGDPTTAGATIAVYNSLSAGGELTVVKLRASGWSAVGPNSYMYRGASTDAITRVILRPDLIAFKGGRTAWTYTLNEPSQGRIAAALIVGDLFWCADAPAKSVGNPPSSASYDRIDKFVAQARTPAPAACVSP
jgi:DNA-binding beta-propeller fold protein YncE/mono/diheme cytochrome c family protein